uniref:Uncharacterized protein n=1 Tax=Brassica campestris TaxID=3711 RepID=M4FDQ7_BRACM
MSAVYLQVSIISQALIFVTRSGSWSFVERAGALLMIAFLIAQLFAIRYMVTGKVWLNLVKNKIAFTTKKDFNKEEREAQWAVAQRTLQGLGSCTHSRGMWNH